MTDPAPPPSKNARRADEADALRANLARRKQQQRQREDARSEAAAPARPCPEPNG